MLDPRLAALALCVVLLVALKPTRPALRTVAVAPARGGQVAAATLLYGGKLDLNAATVADLAALPGIGEVRAQAIAAARAARPGGRFADVSELDAVPGIGEVTLRRLESLVTVGRQSGANVENDAVTPP